MLKALLFDVNNTLATGHWKQGLNELIFAQLGIRGHLDKAKFDEINTQVDSLIKEKDKSDTYYSDWMSLRLDKLAEGLGFNIDQKFKGQILKAIDNYIIDNTDEMDGASGIIEELSKRYRLYVITNGSGRINGVLEKLKIRKFFKGVFISGEILSIKETGGLFDVLIKETKLDPKECLMIGDKLTSDGSCMAFGIRFCFIDRKGQNPESGYDVKINNLSEIDYAIHHLESKF